MWKLNSGEILGAVAPDEIYGVIAGSTADTGEVPASEGAAPALKYLCTSVAGAQASTSPALKYLCTSVASAQGGATPALKYLCTSVAGAQTSAAPALKYLCTSVASSSAEVYGVIAGSTADTGEVRGSATPGNEASNPDDTQQPPAPADLPKSGTDEDAGSRKEDS
jgi:hypothetical protein